MKKFIVTLVLCFSVVSFAFSSCNKPQIDNAAVPSETPQSAKETPVEEVSPQPSLPAINISDPSLCAFVQEQVASHTNLTDYQIKSIKPFTSEDKEKLDELEQTLLDNADYVVLVFFPGTNTKPNTTNPDHGHLMTIYADASFENDEIQWTAKLTAVGCAEWRN